TGKEQASRKAGREAGVSSDGKKLAWSDLEQTITVADAATGKESVTLKGNIKLIKNLGISPDGPTLTSTRSAGHARTSGAGGGSGGIWEGGGGRERRAWRMSRLEVMAFTPDGKVLVTAGSDVVKVWDMVAGTLPPLPPVLKERTALRHPASVYTVAFSNDGK